MKTIPTIQTFENEGMVPLASKHRDTPKNIGAVLKNSLKDSAV